MRFFKWGAFWLAVAALVGFALWRVAINWRPPLSQYPVQGVTVSAESGAIHWPSARIDGVDFAYIVATEGDRRRDARFAANREGARGAGVRHGAIHVWNLCKLASDQATNFIATVPADADALPPAVMLEFSETCPDRPSRDVLLDELASFLALIEPRAGKPAVLRVTRDFDAHYGITSGIDRSFWLTRRLFPPDYGARPWVMWQASDIRRVDGIEHPVRWNVVRR